MAVTVTEGEVRDGCVTSTNVTPRVGPPRLRRDPVGRRLPRLQLLLRDSSVPLLSYARYYADPYT
jgi:hypothetical protein